MGGHVKSYTVKELVAALMSAAADSPLGNETKVCIADWEGNLMANGLVETLQVRYDSGLSRIGIFFDPYESACCERN